MKQVLVKYIPLWLILTSWIILGNILQPLAYVAVIASILLYVYKERYIELFIGFLFILLLSDHVHWGAGDPTKFAKSLKSIYLLVLVFVVVKTRKSFDLQNTIFKFLIPFFIFSFISLNWAINLPIGFQKTLSYSILYIVVPIYFVNTYKSNGKEFLYVLLNYFILILLLGIILKYVYPEAVDSGIERFSGLLGNPNGLGLLIVQIFLLFTILKSFKLVVVSKQLNWIIYTLIIISLLMSGSRNGMISILLFLLFIRLFKIHFLFGIIGLSAAFYSYQLVSIDPVSFVQSLGLEEYFRIQTLESGSGRFIAWEFAWGELQEYFFMGGGFGQDEQVMRPNYAYLQRLNHQGGVHNSYLSLWFDTGLIGVILYFSAMIGLIWGAAKKSSLAWPFFFTILFNIMYESWLVGSLNPFTVVFLCSLTLLVMKDKFVTEADLNAEMSLPVRSET